jgi:hypothetical protein
MDSSGSADDFYERLPVFRDFSRIADETLFHPLPDDWMIGVADVAQSTKAILENRYKAVNMAGAAVIASIANVLKPRDFPFVFGGDGASFAVPAADAALARRALAETATWVAEDLDLRLRIGMISVAEIRAQGNDVRVGRFLASDNISIAMFSGGGLAWADAAMKRGEISLPQAAPGAHPDLSGLSCRYELIPSQRGQVLSLVVMPGVHAHPDDFRSVVQEIVRIVEETPGASRPVAGQALLRRRCEGALGTRYGSAPGRDVLDRLDAELAVVAQLGYATYFLTVAEVVDLIRDMGVRVAARGSGAGSLVNYLLGVSGVDPLAHGLLMERFLSPLRRALPDIDVDVESARRSEVYERILARFGGERCACVSMMDTYRVRHAIRDVGAALGLPPGEIER